jgi:uncharacterized protein YwgA
LSDDLKRLNLSSTPKQNDSDVEEILKYEELKDLDDEKTMSLMRSHVVYLHRDERPFTDNDNVAQAFFKVMYF